MVGPDRPAAAPDHCRRGWSGPVAATLAALVALTRGLGGFERRTDLLRPTAVGTLVRTGPDELRFIGATAQRRTTYDDRVLWRVTAIGEGRTTGDQTVAPDHLGDDGMFAATDTASGEVVIPESQTFRPGGFVRSSAFTPGLPLQPCTIQFDFPPTYRPGPTISFVVFDLEFRDNSLLGDQDPQWRNADEASRFELPRRAAG